MDSYEQIMTAIENSRIGLDDTFDFRCRGCGKCCKHRTDLVFTAHDVFRIAQFLGRSTQEIIEGYCEIIPGADSHIPVVHVVPQGPEKICPFLLGRKCKVHAAKPAVCALFPLARFYKDGEEIIILQTDQVGCGRKDGVRTTTVRKWIGDLADEESRSIGKLWAEICFQLTVKLKELHSSPLMKDPAILDMVFQAMAQDLYFGYNTEEPFFPQLCARQERLNLLFKVFQDVLDNKFCNGEVQS